MSGSPLNLEILVSQPAGGPLAQGYMSGAAEATPFYGQHFSDPAAYAAKAGEVDARFSRDTRERAAQALKVPEGGDRDRIRRFVEEGGYMVTTGQQPGLFGGPLYSIYKGLTAIRLAQALEAHLGKPVLPVFWVASDDHDWAEANHTCIVGVDNELHCPELAAPDPDIHPPLHRIAAGPGVSSLVDEFLENLPESDFSRPFFELIRGAFTPDATLPQSFSAVLEALLGPRGMYFTDAAQPTVKDASMPLLLEELERSEEMEGVLAETGRALSDAGFDLQVALMEGGVNLFLEGPAGRERLYREGDGFRLRISGEHLTADQIRERVAEDPSVLSPNVLLRPVAESVVFPTLSYVAGPGETAYFGQLAAYFQAHGVQMPVIHPRFGAMLVEGKIRKVLDKFHLDVADLNRPFHEIAGEIAREEVPEGIRKALGTLRGAIGKGVGELQNEVKAVDPTLKGTVQHVRSQAFSALDDVEKKVLHALKRENEIALNQLEKAQHHLFPQGKPQERVVNPFYYLARYGGAFLDELLERFALNVQGG